MRISKCCLDDKISSSFKKCHKLLLLDVRYSCLKQFRNGRNMWNIGKNNHIGTFVKEDYRQSEDIRKFHVRINFKMSMD